MSEQLLPANATPIMVAAVQAADPTARMLPAIEFIRAWKHNSPPEALLPFLVDEYGLGPLSPYLPNLNDLISDGVQWQRIRGTPAAVAMGLGFIGHAGTIEENPTQRRWWNAFALALASIPPESDLNRIEGIASLSVPLRSDFRRGYRGYDVRGFEAGRSRLGQAILETDSGLQLRAGGPLWSFGRAHEAMAALDADALQALGVWLPETGPIGWGDFTAAEADFPADALWQDVRGRVMLRRIVKRRAHLRLSGPDGIAGHVLAQAVIDGNRIKISARSPFDTGTGAVTSAALVFDGVPSAADKPGKAWLGPSGLSGGVVVPLSVPSFPIQMTRTLRELFNIEVTV